MIRSKTVTDYFEIPIEEIRPLARLEFDIHVYFPQNQHMMVLCHKGETPSVQFLEKYQSRRLNKVWIHNDDIESFRHYKTPRTMEGAFLSALLTDTAIKNSDEKKAVVSEVARLLLQDTCKPNTLEQQLEATSKLRQTILDVLDKTAYRSESAVLEIFRLCEVDPALQHGINVAAFGMTFAMAFGRIETDLLADIALAGLLHDVGIVEIPYDIAIQNYQAMQKDDQQAYFKHVISGLSILEEYSFTLPDRVKTIIHQHHEKFNGTGYPEGLRGVGVNDIAQLLSMADVVDTFASGRHDGQKRTIRQTIEMLAEIEKSATSAEYFNPDIFSAVMRWVTETEADERLTKVEETVSHQAEQLLRQS